MSSAVEGFELLREVRDYAIYMLDTQGIVRTWNDGARAIKGYAAEEIIGQHFSRFFTDDDRASGRPERLLGAALADGRVEDQAWRVRKDGTRFWALVVITAIHRKDGQLRGFVKVTRDLTEQRSHHELLRQSEERLRLLIEGVRDYAIFMLDAHGKILSWNTGAERISGYRADEVIGRHFSIFYPQELRELGHPERELQIAQRDGRYEEQGLRVRKDGERYWANVVLTAVHEPGTGRLHGFAKVTRDLTERRQAEEAMRAASEQLSLERARTEEVRGALKLRDEFISVAAHELRTPLATLQLKVQSARSLASKDGERDQPEARAKLSARLDGALKQIERLSGLVRRLLDASSIIRGQLNARFETVSMRELVERSVDDLREAAESAGCELKISALGPAIGRWDPTRIEQVITNLLSNAIKYAAGKPIEVSIEEDPQNVRVSVLDRGIGIAAGDLDRIFGRFERAVPVKHYAGLGLGLYIAKSIVDAHGGSIQVTSSEDRGSTFTIVLPRGNDPGAAESHDVLQHDEPSV